MLLLKTTEKTMKSLLFCLALLLSFSAHADISAAKIKQIVNEAVASKKFAANIELVVNTTDKNAHSPGYAVFDFQKNVCQFKLNENALKESIFKEKLLKFFIYHELSHCDFFAHPFVTFNFKELTTAQNKILNDFVFLDILLQTEKRLNAYNVYHEAYADVRAMALLLAEGYTPDDFKQLMALRLDDSLDGHHSTASGFGEVFQQNWKAMSPKEVQDKVVLISGKITLNNFFADFYSKYEGTTDAFFNIYTSNVASMVTTYFYNFESDKEFHEERFLLIKDNVIINKYPLWNFVSQNLLVVPKHKTADVFLAKLDKNLYQNALKKDSAAIESFIKNYLAKQPAKT